MNKKKQSKEIYELLFAKLKAALAKDDVQPAVMKIALDFIKTYELDVEVTVEDRDIDDFLSSLPFEESIDEGK
jgi:hypothetical protein